jgi:Ca2+-binding EF-hand superfamily protein
MAQYLLDVALYHVQLHNRRSSQEPQEEWNNIEQQLRENWGTILKAQYSLLLSVSGGADWGDLAAPFCAINPINCVLYSTWVIVVIFGLINITVGVFTGQARQFHQYDRLLLVESALADHRSMSNTLTDLFDRIDTNNNGFLSRTEIEQGLKDIHIQAYFAQLNIDVEMNPDEFFGLLDEDKNDMVDRDEFVTICMRLQGGAKALQLARIMSNMEEVKSQLQDVKVAVGSMSRHSS